MVLGSSHNIDHSCIPIITLDTSSNMVNDHDNKHTDVDPKALQRLLVEQMASSLTRDPSFTSALAAAISGKMMQI